MRGFMSNGRGYLAFICAAAAALLHGGAVDPAGLVLRDGAKVVNGILVLDGRKAYARIPGTEKYNVSRDGLTLACAVRLADTTSRETARTLDTFFSKEKTPFLFARYDRKLASNIRDASGKVAAKTRADKIPRQGKWCHAAVTYEFLDDTAQGETAYVTTLYLDGEKVAREKHPFLEPLQSTGDLLVGRGYGQPWFLAGEVTDIFAAPRALSEGEIGALARACGRIRRAPDKKRIPAKGVRRIRTPEAEFLIRTLPGRGTPVAGILDGKAGRNVIDGGLFSWEVRGARAGRKITVGPGDAVFGISGLDEKGFAAEWKVRGSVSLDVRSNYAFCGDGLCADLKIKNLTPGLVITEVVFPRVKIPKFQGGDILFYPYMCGAEVADPARSVLRYGQSYAYPSANVSMQYSAYYSGGRGVFLGWRDPKGTVKNFSAAGKYDGIVMTWTLPAAIPLDKTAGGNDFASPGKVVFKLFSGGWYEAAMIHRAWALEKAEWGKVPYPRKDTPGWFREVPCALAPNGLDEKAAAEGIDQLLFLRKYLDVPVYAMWFNWYDSSARGWPVFRPRPHTRSDFARIMASGCYIEPYTDGRLWDTSDREWETHGKKYAVKRADGSIPVERYGKSTYAPMCPGVAAWGDVLVKLSGSIAPTASAVYHDQVTAARGELCFDPTHGHALNDPALWLDGYRRIYREIRRTVPDRPHVSEDMAEPYLDLFDGGHVWRWGFQGAVPAFQAVYGGRMQYLALVYDKIAKGEPESNFSKMAYSLVNGIKIGRMEVQELFFADEKRLFFKKMSHLFVALSPYFSGGNMLAPVRFATPVPTQSLMWSGHWRRNEKVTTPVIMSKGYELGDCRIYVFVNPTAQTQTCRPEIPAGKLCMEGAARPADFTGPITLPPRCSAVVVSGSEAEARRIQETLRRIAAFDPGQDYGTQIRFPDRPALRLARGELASADRNGGYFGAMLTGRKRKFFGNIRENGLITWGTVDFGSETVKEIFLHVGVSKEFSGGRITVLTGKEPGKEIPLGTFTVPDTGSWMKFQKYPLKLATPLTGKCRIVFRFDRNGCCNFLGWEY